MPGKPGPGQNVGGLKQGSSEQTAGGTAFARPAKALTGWHDLNMAVARDLPTALLRAGQLHRAALLNLRAASRVRR
jgi:hypothetical protein